VPVARFSTGGAGIGLVIVSVICAGIATWMVLLAAWFPTMRYELDSQVLVIHYGPIINWRVPLREVKSVTVSDLNLSVLAATRLPGIALLTVFYTGTGNVRMCATRAAKQIIVIDAGRHLYGVTPAEADEFVAAIRARAHG